MASNVANTAGQIIEPEIESPEEPSMDDILQTIKQIIADDEAGDDGLSERERYTHPTDHSNSNFDDAVGELEAAMAEELRQSTAEAGEVSESGSVIPDVEPPVAAAPKSMEDRAAEVRSEFSAAGNGLTADERLEKYRIRGKLQMESLAARKAEEAANPTPEPEISPAVAAGPILPTTHAIAQEMAATMMREKSPEIVSALSEMMRPTIRQWLSDNLPSMVEKLVREEIEAVSRGKKAS